MSAKTHKGLKKRLKKTATGKVLRRHSGTSHLMSGKSPKRARKLRQWTTLSDGDNKAFVRQYGNL